MRAHLEAADADDVSVFDPAVDSDGRKEAGAGKQIVPLATTLKERRVSLRREHPCPGQLLELSERGHVVEVRLRRQQELDILELEAKRADALRNRGGVLREA